MSTFIASSAGPPAGSHKTRAVNRRHGVAAARRRFGLPIRLWTPYPLTTPMFPRRSATRSNRAQLHHEPQRLDGALCIRKFSSNVVRQHANVRRRARPPSEQPLASPNSDPSSVGVGAPVLELVSFTHRLGGRFQ
jgi:hypothetical protein